jgi:hypothetical protein
MKLFNSKLTLYDQMCYRITVSGHLDENFTQGTREITVEARDSIDSCPVTTITCTTDQAGLMGMLRRLYTLGLPLISVNLARQ